MKISRGESLDRYYLLKLFGLGIFLHRIHRSDPVGLFHSHPWSGLSLIFGSYTEEAFDGRIYRRRFWNWLTAARHHRVIIDRPVWTLFIHLPRSNRWAVLNENGALHAVEPWRGEHGHKDYRTALPTKQTHV